MYIAQSSDLGNAARRAPSPSSEYAIVFRPLVLRMRLTHSEHGWLIDSSTFPLTMLRTRITASVTLRTLRAGKTPLETSVSRASSARASACAAESFPRSTRTLFRYVMMATCLFLSGEPHGGDFLLIPSYGSRHSGSVDDTVRGNQAVVTGHGKDSGRVHL